MYCHLQVGFITALWLFYSTLCFLPLLLCSIFFFSLQGFYISYFSRISLVYSNNPGASAPDQLEILLFWEAASHEPLLLPLPGCCIDGVLMNACYWSLMGFKHSISGHTRWKNRRGKKERGVACVELLPVLSSSSCASVTWSADRCASLW